MKKLILILAFVMISAACPASDGVITRTSRHDVSATADRLENILTQKGMTVFNRISHSDGARTVGVDLRPTELLIFGNPKVGSPLMSCSQITAIDLPQKMLVWEDADGKTYLSYNDPAYLAKRHAIEGCGEVLGKIGRALANIAEAAAGP